MRDLPTRLFLGDGELRYPEADNKNPNHDEKDEHPVATRLTAIFLGGHIDLSNLIRNPTTMKSIPNFNSLINLEVGFTIFCPLASISGTSVGGIGSPIIPGTSVGCFGFVIIP